LLSLEKGIMKKYISSVVFASIIFLTSCSGQGGGKGQAVEPLYDASSTTETAAPSGRKIVKMELPAPLNDRPEIILTRKGYTVSYNKSTKTPNWVAWHLTRSHTSGRAQRSQEMFAEDESVPSPRATNADYYGKRYDRGHMCPAGDNKWDMTAMEETFLLTNICPQNHNLNKYEWNDIENLCREWARTYGAVDIVCGPVYYDDARVTYTGKNKVRVPDAFFKVVLCRYENGNPAAKAVGFVYKNIGSKQDVANCIRTVDEVEKLTGIDFFHALDDRTEESVEAHSAINSWNPNKPVRYNNY